MKAKAILLDMEPKVVQKCLNSAKFYDPAMSYYKQGGSGNNWALGYQYLTDDVWFETSNRMQTMLEKQDYF